VKIWFFGMVAAAAVVFAPGAKAQVMEVSPQGQAVRLELAPGNGVTISFRRLGETIERVWVDNQTFFTLNSDRCLVGLEEENQECTSSGATLLHLRRIERLDIPGLLPNTTAQLTVITAQSDLPYLFKIVPNGEPEALVYEVVPPRSAPDWSHLAALRLGVELARELDLLPESSPLWGRLAALERLLQQGFELRYAAAEAGVSLELVERLVADAKVSPGVSEHPELHWEPPEQLLVEGNGVEEEENEY
jgi:hypothetical protein